MRSGACSGIGFRSILEACSETLGTQKPSWDVRERGYLKRTAPGEVPRPVLLVSAAIKLSSLISTVDDLGRSVWNG